jgi:hypothetical protein
LVDSLVIVGHQAHKTTSFHPQTDDKIKVVNQMIVHILCIYNSEHPDTWDESLPYVQHSYNMVLHSSTNHSPFQMDLGFQPLAPVDVALPLAIAHTNSSHDQSVTDKASRFIERIQHILQQVQEILQKSNAKYKKHHDQRKLPHQFQVTFAEGASHEAPSEALPTSLWSLHYHQGCG